MRGGKASSRRAIAAERREAAWKLRKRGHSFQQIADELGPDYGGYSKSSAERDIKRVLNELNERTLETAAEARALDLARLDELLVAWFATALREGERPARRGGAETAEGEKAEGEPAGDDLVKAWFTAALRDGTGKSAEADQSALDAIDWSTLSPMDLLDALFKQAMLSKQAAEIVFKALEQRAKLLGLHRQEFALTTPTPLQVAADLSGLDEESLDAIIRNLTAALGAGEN